MCDGRTKRIDGPSRLSCRQHLFNLNFRRGILRGMFGGRGNLCSSIHPGPFHRLSLDRLGAIRVQLWLKFNQKNGIFLCVSHRLRRVKIPPATAVVAPTIDFRALGTDLTVGPFASLVVQK